MLGQEQRLGWAGAFSLFFCVAQRHLCLAQRDFAAGYSLPPGMWGEEK